MRKFAFCFLLSSPVFAAGGFTWMGQLAHWLHLPKGSEHFLTFGFIGAIIIVVGIVYCRRVAKLSRPFLPDSKISLRGLVEAYGQFIYNLCQASLGQKAPQYFPFIATLFIFIFLSNAIGLIPGFLPPTEQISTTLALSLLAFVYYNYRGCYEVGTWNYFKHFAGPMLALAPLVLPIEILSNFIRPASLSLRLWGNIYGDHVILNVFSELAPWGLLIPVIFLFLGLVISLIQAYVFTSLTIVYINLAIAEGDHH